ncbi:hypothetical protein QAD02_016636 [Eretmocerus hayati]|uniref:Uncharacterized protein n=1 Tax=Eretmocerus hayati TaxID=131215 RepID=A0ACC2PC39_9HYME|nr:hypothetical protein QAD02_016636 [Eretmocerus hayati]
MSSDPRAEKLKDVKSILRSLLVARAKEVTTLRQLNGLYREEEDANIPFREFGYSSIEEFLMDIPDTVKLFMNQGNVCVRFIESEASAHVASLVSRQKKPPAKKSFSVGYRSSGHRFYNQRSHNFSRPPPPRNFNRLPDLSVLSNILVRGREYLHNIRSNRGIRKSELMGEMSKVLKGQPYNLANLNSQLSALASKHNIFLEGDCIYFKDLQLNKNTNYSNGSRIGSQSELVSAQQHKTPPISQEVNHTANGYSSVPNHTQNQNPVNQPLTNGYHSMEQDNSSHLNGNTNGNYEHTDDHNEHNGIGSCTGDLEDPSSMLKERTRIRLLKLLQKHPEGIWCAELPNLYKDEYVVDLEYEDLGFSNITEFVNAFPDIFIVSDPMQNNKLMVTDATLSYRNINNNYQKKTMASAYNIEEYIQPEPDPVPIKLSSNVTQSLIPEGVMSINETVEQIEVGTLIHEEYIEVHISEIFTPSFFWIQLRKHKKKLTALMSHLQEYYTDAELKLNLYKIPQVVLEPGLNIACKYGKDWHRGMIKKVRPDGYAIVWFFDYGTVKSYNPNDLYFLHKRFSTLPAQAIACALHNVRPVASTDWAFTSTDPFINKVWEIPMAALIAEIDEEKNSMMVSLVDTSDEHEDLHINDWMVENGYAEYGRMEDCPPLHRLHLFEEQMIIRMKDQERMRLKIERRLKREMQRENDYLNYIEKRESSNPSPCPSARTDTHSANKIVASNKEHIGLMNLMKQTNTLTQALVLSTCSGQKTKYSNGYISDSRSIPAGLEQNYRGTSCDSLDNQEKIGDLTNNFKSMKVNLFDRRKNRYGSNDSMMNYSTKLENNFDFKSSMHSVNSSHPSYKDEPISTQHMNSTAEAGSKNYETYNRSDRPSPVNSLFSQPSLFNFESDSRIKGENNSEKFDFKDGTLTMEVKIEPDLPASNYDDALPKFSDINMNKINLDRNFDIKKENIKQEIIHEADEGYHTAAPSRSQTVGSLTNPVCTTTATPAAFTVTQVGNDEDSKTIHLFHMDNEGWISANEFVDAFTNLKDQRIMFKLLEVLEYPVNFRSISRDMDPQLFDQLDINLMKASQGLDENILPDFVLVLMPLKSMLQVLDKLDFLSAKMLKDAVPYMKQYKEKARDVLYEKFQNEILYDALNLLLEYKKFRALLMSAGQ